MKKEPEKLLLDYEDAAYSLSITVQALRDRVYKGVGPVPVRVGRRRFFRPDDLRKYVDSL